MASAPAAASAAAVAGVEEEQEVQDTWPFKEILEMPGQRPLSERLIECIGVDVTPTKTAEVLAVLRARGNMADEVSAGSGAEAVTSPLPRRGSARGCSRRTLSRRERPGL